ncbi:MAG TPA: DnaB-like helicase N-terminal domain-containing protein, partial [Acetobacteraceae bacterium]|nr:DnaB-like helicase N-terminal domain-containing protein [Acetobacteraceae bacterium]
MNVIDSPLLGLSQRLPPANLEAEQALLGALLANNKAYERVSEFLSPEHFADAIHGK